MKVYIAGVNRHGEMLGTNAKVKIREGTWIFKHISATYSFLKDTHTHTTHKRVWKNTKPTNVST